MPKNAYGWVKEANDAASPEQKIRFLREAEGAAEYGPEWAVDSVPWQQQTFVFARESADLMRTRSYRVKRRTVRIALITGDRVRGPG